METEKANGEYAAGLKAEIDMKSIARHVDAVIDEIDKQARKFFEGRHYEPIFIQTSFQVFQLWVRYFQEHLDRYAKEVNENVAKSKRN